MKKNILFTFLLTLILGNSIKAQSLEFGVMGGACTYMGDLSDMIPRIDLAKPAAGVLVRFNPDRYIGLRMSFLRSEIGGADSLSNNAERRLRNLSFKSVVLDFNAQFEWNLAGFCFPEGQKYYGFSPYLFTGVNLFKFNPKAYYKGDWYELQPLRTEGQGTLQRQGFLPYELTQFALPLGAGFRVRLSDNWNLGLEYGFRFTFTDYIDDVSGTYFDPEVLRRNTSNDNPAAELSDRSGEVNNGVNIGTNPDGSGNLRGNKNTPADYFMFGTFSICYRFPLPGIKCTSF